VGMAFALCYQFVETLMAWLIAPLKALDPAAKVQVIGTGLAEAFFTKLKVSFIAGIFLASPVIFYQIWRFVAPGLYEHERRYVQPFLFFATGFFVFGSLFCYRFSLPSAFVC